MPTNPSTLLPLSPPALPDPSPPPYSIPFLPRIDLDIGKGSARVLGRGIRWPRVWGSAPAAAQSQCPSSETLPKLPRAAVPCSTGFVKRHRFYSVKDNSATSQDGGSIFLASYFFRQSGTEISQLFQLTFARHLQMHQLTPQPGDQPCNSQG